MMDTRSKLLVLFLLLPVWAPAQPGKDMSGMQPSPREIQADLLRAERYVAVNKSDSAGLILDRLMPVLQKRDMLDAPPGLKARLLRGTALADAGRDTAALQMLRPVKERSGELGLWDIHARACLALARLYESIKRSAACLASLEEARAAIGRHELDSLFPQYAIRRSSYYRIFTVHSDSAIYYAREALRTAPLMDQPLQEAWAHLLLAMLYNETDLELKHNEKHPGLEHYQAAALILREIDDYAGLSSLMGNLTGAYFRQGELAKALAYNDSMILCLETSIAQGYKLKELFPVAYKIRGNIFHKMGQHDSAWHNLRKGYDFELLNLREAQDHKVIEVDARYNDEKRIREIEAEKARKNLLGAVILVMLLLGSGLAYLYIRLQKVNRKTRLQAEQLKELDRAKSRFFANLSHELRTPLTLVLSPVSTLLRENRLDPDQTKLLKTAASNAKKLNDLVSQILDLGKLEAGKLALDLQPTRLAGYFRGQIGQFEPEARRRQLDFSYDIDAADDLVVNLDREKCRQLVHNLLSNAVKFTPAGGRITVALKAGDPAPGKDGDAATAQIPLQITVEDTGRGIHPDDLPYVFDRFFQTGRPGAAAEGGTGIGLALCREYVALFGGRIRAESNPGAGSVFQVEFPVAVLRPEELSEVAAQRDDPFYAEAADMTDLPVSHMAPIAFDPARPTVLLVEDTAGIRDYLYLLLRSRYNLVMAENGRQALDLLGDLGYPVDLVISDLMMPVMDGYQLLEALKSDDATRHIPVIMLTARAETQDRLRALRTGVDDYLTKPFDDEELTARIENLLEHARNRQLAHVEEVFLAEVAPADTEELLISSSDSAWLETFEAYIRRHLSSDLLSVTMLAQEFAMSESTLLRQLKRLTGLSPKQYMQEIRLSIALEMLENRAHRSVAEVAYGVGYGDTRSFSRSFKQRYGKSPSDYMGV